MSLLVHMQVVLFIAWLHQQKSYAAVRLCIAMPVAIPPIASTLIDIY